MSETIGRWMAVLSTFIMTGGLLAQAQAPVSTGEIQKNASSPIEEKEESLKKKYRLPPKENKRAADKQTNAGRAVLLRPTVRGAGAERARLRAQSFDGEQAVRAA